MNKIALVLCALCLSLPAFARTTTITSRVARDFVQAVLANGYPMLVVDANTRKEVLINPVECRFDRQGLPDDLLATADCFENAPSGPMAHPWNGVALALQLQKYGKQTVNFGFPVFRIMSAQCTNKLMPPRYECTIKAED